MQTIKLHLSRVALLKFKNPLLFYPNELQANLSNSANFSEEAVPVGFSKSFVLLVELGNILDKRLCCLY